MEEQEHGSSHLSETTRLEGFSDGVFGIAITLLVLEIRLPVTADPAKAGSLVPALLNLWQIYLAYITSFLSICVLWVGHHDLFRIIRRVDRPLLFMNAGLLMVITFLNFPTVIMDEYFRQPDAQIAALFYSGTLFVIALLFNAIWRYAASSPALLKENFDPVLGREFTRQYLVRPVGYFVAVLLAFVNATLCIFVCLLVLVFFALSLRWHKRP